MITFNLAGSVTVSRHHRGVFFPPGQASAVTLVPAGCDGASFSGHPPVKSHLEGPFPPGPERKPGHHRIVVALH